MPRAFDEVALIKIIRAHADANEVLHEFALDVNIIVNAGEEHGLVAQRDSSPR